MDFLSAMTLTDLTGYLASAFILGAFFLNDVRKLRIVNSIGCIFFVIYGFRLGKDLPLMITNGAILLLNIYYVFIKKN